MARKRLYASDAERQAAFRRKRSETMLYISKEDLKEVYQRVHALNDLMFDYLSLHEEFPSELSVEGLKTALDRMIGVAEQGLEKIAEREGIDLQ